LNYFDLPFQTHVIHAPYVVPRNQTCRANGDPTQPRWDRHKLSYQSPYEKRDCPDHAYHGDTPNDVEETVVESSNVIRQIIEGFEASEQPSSRAGKCRQKDRSHDDRGQDVEGSESAHDVPRADKYRLEMGKK
jgi:hypothetical protein